MSLILEGLKEPARVQLKMTDQAENTTLFFSARNLPSVFSTDTDISVTFYYLSIIMKTWLFIVINTNTLILKNRFWLQQDFLVRKKRHSYKRKKLFLTASSRCLYGRSRDKTFVIRLSLSF